MDVQQTSLIVADERRAKDTHIACQHHQIRGVGVDFMHQLTIECFPVGKLTLRQRMGRDAGRARAQGRTHQPCY